MYTYTSNLYDYSFSKKIEYSNYRSSNTRIVILKEINVCACLEPAKTSSHCVARKG